MAKKMYFPTMVFAACFLLPATFGCGGNSETKAFSNEQTLLFNDYDSALISRDSISIGEEAAMDILTSILGDRFKQGMALLSSGEGEMNGQPCWKFEFGTSSEEKFTTEDHFAVTSDGSIYVLDIINNEYVPYNHVD